MTGPVRARRRGWVALLTILALAFGTVIVLVNRPSPPVSRGGPPVASVPVPTTTAAPSRTPAAPRTGLAAAAVAAAEGAADPTTDLAVAVLDRVTGRDRHGPRGTEPYLTASLSKLVLAVDMVDRRRLEALAITDVDLQLLRRALGPSDDAAMSALWSRFDGPGAALRLTQRIGLVGTLAPRDTSRWGEMIVPAADMLRIWQHLLDGMPTVDRELLLDSMRAVPADATDGFDQAYGLLAPDLVAPVGATKQAWMCCFSGRYHLHSVGVVGPDERFVVILLTTVLRGPGWEAARQQLDRTATATLQALYPAVAG